MSNRFPLFLVSLAVACTAPKPELDPALAEAVAESGATTAELPGARRNLVLTATPLVPGGPVTFTITGASPNEQVHITRSTSGPGAGPCLGTASLLCLDITSVVLHGSLVADASGTGTLEQTLPEHLPLGVDVWFQAVLPLGTSGASWVKSDVLDVQLEDAALNQATVQPGDLVVTEIMQNPDAVSDTNGEWLEVHNPTTLDANLAGLELTDFGLDSYVISPNLFLPAGGYVVLGRNGDLATNGGVPVDHEYSNVDLGNGFDELHLVAGATIIDSVAWDDGQSFPDPVGASMELDWLSLDTSDNDAGASWAPATSVYGSGDLGTPGRGPTDASRWLYSIEQDTDELHRVNLDTLTWEVVGPLGTDFELGDLAYDPIEQVLYMVDGRAGQSLWTVDVETGAATLVGDHGQMDMFGLVWDPRTESLYGGVMASNPQPGMYELNPTTGAATFLGTTGNSLGALTYDPVRDTLVGIIGGSGDIYEIDPVAVTSTLLHDGDPVDDCGLAYDGLTDTYWVADGSGDLFGYDPNDGYARSVHTELASYDGLVWVPFAP